MKRDATTDTTAMLTADTLVRTGPGTVISITLAWIGCTVGEFCTIVNGLSMAGGNSEIVIPYATANGIYQLNFPEGIPFTVGIFFNKGATVGSVYAKLTYK